MTATSETGEENTERALSYRTPDSDLLEGGEFGKTPPNCQHNSPQARIADSSSRNAVSFSSARTTKRFPSSRCASAIQIVRHSRSHFGRVFRVPAPGPARDVDSNRSLKIRPDLSVFFVANAAHSLQIISASERSRRDNARRHHVPDSRHGC